MGINSLSRLYKDYGNKKVISSAYVGFLNMKGRFREKKINEWIISQITSLS